MLHAQLMNWYRQAKINNDIVKQQYLASKYHFYFDSVIVSGYTDINFNDLMNQNQVGQHQIMTFELIQNEIANALYQFAIYSDPFTTVTIDYCKKMAWSGTTDSQAFKDLNQGMKDLIIEITEGERGNDSVSPNYYKKGKPCN